MAFGHTPQDSTQGSTQGASQGASAFVPPNNPMGAAQANTESTIKPMNSGFNDGWSFLDTVVPGAVNGSGGNEQVVMLKEKMEECAKHSKHSKNIKLIVLDNKSTKGLYFSTILVCYYGGKGIGVAYIPLIMESSNEPVPTYMDTTAGISVEVFRASSETYDADLVTFSNNQVALEYPNEIIRVCEGIVIPRNFDVTDRVKVSNLFALAGCAVGLRLQLGQPNFKDLDLTKGKNDSVKELNISFGRQQLINSLGDPIRSDFVVNLIAKANGNNNNRSLNGAPKVSTISNVSGFFDLVYAPAVPNGTAKFQMMNGQHNPNLFRKWVPRAIITDVSSAFSNTPANILLSILTVVTLRDNFRWLQAFRTSGRSTGVDLTDIGALNFEANLPGVEGYNPASIYGRRKNTKGGNVSWGEICEFINAVMYEQPIFSIDVPEAGPQSWYLGVIAAAAKGSPSAIQLFLSTLDRLTGGHFMPLWNMQPDKTLFVDTNNRVLLGYYTAEDGTLHDIRDWDYLAVANFMGDKAPDLIAEWSDTFYNESLSSEIKLARRRKMTSDLTRETAVFTGHAQRVTFSGTLLQVAVAASNAAGLSIKQVNNSVDNGQGRGVANFAQMAMMPLGTPSFSQYSTVGNGGINYGGFWPTY